MSSNFELFKKQLDDAVGLIEKTRAVDAPPPALLESMNNLVDTTSLISRCESVCEIHKAKKPTIRIIRHLACSGGTLISKCIAAMPNVYLLSEVHPYNKLGSDTGKPKYAPSDIISLTKYAGIPEQKNLAAALFKTSIDEVYKHVTRYGGTLVLREHTHSDFNTDDPEPKNSSIVELLKDSYDVKSILTIRDPIDSYSSLVKNGWVHFEPNTFDEYCRRLLLLIAQFPEPRIFTYETFTVRPKEQIENMTRALELPFDDSFEHIFSIFRVTGDSGRSSDVISPRKRLASEDILLEAEKSKHYKDFLKLNLLNPSERTLG